MDKPAHEAAEPCSAATVAMMLRTQRHVLEATARRRPPAETLEHVCRAVESLLPGCMCSVMARETADAPLQLVAAPSIPPAVRAHLQSLPSEPGTGSCVAAVLTGSPAIVADVTTDPRWASLRGLAAEVGIGACWSYPLHLGRDAPDGSFAIASAQARAPGPLESHLLEFGAGLAALTLTSAREHQAEREARMVFDRNTEGIVVCDWRGRIRNANRAFCTLAGRPLEALRGRRASALFDRATRDVRRSLLDGLARAGRWQGEGILGCGNGTATPVWVNLSRLGGDGEDTGAIVALVSDISAIKASENRLAHLAYHDALTGLGNRLALHRSLRAALDEIAARPDAPTELAVVLIDLDRLGDVNTSRGHAVGDQLLTQAARRLRACVESRGEVARLGGDEFAVLLRLDPEAEPLQAVLVRIRKRLSRPFVIDRGTVHVSACIGVAVGPRDGADAETLLRNADTALHAAKRRGPDANRIYTRGLTRRVARHHQLATALRSALGRDELHLEYQPIVDSDGLVVRVEALARWECPRFGSVSPEEFIPVAESTGLIRSLGAWVLRSACADATLLAPSIAVAVNFSRAQLVTGADALLRTVLRHTGLAPERLELEITERAVERASEDPRVLERIRALGVRLAIDDFGTGYASLVDLKRLPVQTLKLAGSLVRDVGRDPNDEAIVRAGLALGRALGLAVIAEGVETEAQRAALRAEGCELFQGHLFATPMRIENLRACLRDPGLVVPCAAHGAVGIGATALPTATDRGAARWHPEHPRS